MLTARKIKSALAALSLSAVGCFCLPACYADTAKIAQLLQAMTTQYNAGQYVQAGHTGQEILALDANNLSAHYMMGNIFLQAQVLESAGNEYDWCVAHGAGTAIAVNARHALDVMEGKVAPAATAHAALATTKAAGQAAAPPQSGQAINAPLPTQFFNPLNPQLNTQPNTQLNTSASAPAGKPAFIEFRPFSNPNAAAALEQKMETQRFEALRAPRGATPYAIEKVRDQMLMDKIKIDVKKEVMDVWIRRETDLASWKTSLLQRFISNSGITIPNPDYQPEVDRINREAESHIKVLHDDYERERHALTEDYNAMLTSTTKSTTP